MRLTIDKQMKMKYIDRIIYLNLDVEYNVNELILMTHISTSQHVELKTFWVSIEYSLIVYLNLVYRKQIIGSKNQKSSVQCVSF